MSMVDPQPVHFIGGPRDGQRMMLRHMSDYYDVALQAPLSGYSPVMDTETVMTVERFTYRRFHFYRGLTVFVPKAWLDERDPTEFVLKQLLRGYVGNRT